MIPGTSSQDQNLSYNKAVARTQKEETLAQSEVELTIILLTTQCGPRLRALRAALSFEKASRAAKIKSRF